MLGKKMKIVNSADVTFIVSISFAVAAAGYIFGGRDAGKIPLYLVGGLVGGVIGISIWNACGIIFKKIKTEYTF